MPDENSPPADVPPQALVPADADADADADAGADAAPVESPKPTLADLSPAACAASLAELFPALFGAGAPKPLKLRIQADIQQRAPGIFTKKSLSVFLHRHTTNTAYLIGLSRAPSRFDLDGAAAGEISAEHRDAASAELARRRALHEERRAAEHAARHAAEAETRRARDADFQARRERAALLRSFETTTLTRANFCALKGISETDLDAALAQARQEREQRPPEPARPPQRGPNEREQRFERKGAPRPTGRPARPAPR